MPPGASPARSAAPLVLGVLSILFGATLLVSTATGLLALDALDRSTQRQDPDLPAPQAGLMAAMTEQIIEVDPRLRAMHWLLQAIGLWMPGPLLLLGVGLVRYRRWAARLTVVWSVAALLCLSGLVVLAILTHTMGSLAPLILVLAPYPIVLFLLLNRPRTVAATVPPVK